ncbi:DUF5020 family protein [Prolixibacter denitrificans]|uniref:DUF5020 domain-containing protein n=1 Tax=Prolixibacter denitrificans TaxID=1541063 RepID=A0A2P8CHL0_9BACT|nr:DUF5020 family protein [Prolixibacter denitrificans]PSK84461.1 uncharacterized protein DUF5020 [Prolixibacter denitrificans]GET20634.1 DUF5020 domain-containing protein [Prolixibacter denitrificans]
MKKILFALSFLMAFTALEAQDIQLHYDLGKDRKYLTSTVEMFKPDQYGSTFFFIDMDYGANDVQGVALAYWEIARGLKFWDNPFEIHVEYNGGFGQYAPGGAYQINDAWLFGGNYTWNTADYSKIFTLQLMYKTIRGKNKNSFQVTGVWTLQFFNNKLTLDGFADFWREDNMFADKSTKFVFLSEPQFWYNVTKNFSVGSEIELSTNFGGHEGFMVNPTIAGKWTF